MKLKFSIWIALALVGILLISNVAAAAMPEFAAEKKDDERSLESYVTVHYKKDNAKPDSPPGKDKKPKPDEDGTYKTYGRGVVWKDLPFDYVIDTDFNVDYDEDGVNDLSANFIEDTISASMETWDDESSTNIIGTYTLDTDASWDSDSPDGQNEILFDTYSDPNVIGVAIVWGYFSGPPQTREIIEFDILFNTGSTWMWGDATLDSTMMDLQNIATHEIGHGLGLADLYDSGDSEETMYGYGTEGETKKRDLYNGDIAGIQSLYGV